MWNRPYIPRLSTSAVAWTPFHVGSFGCDLGGEIKLLSHDPDDGAATYLWRVPPGWSQQGGFVLAGSEQLFLLSGDLRKGTDKFTQGCFGYRPPGHTHEDMRSESGAVALIMWDSRVDPKLNCNQFPAGDGLRIIDTKRMEEVPTPVTGPPTGIVVKILNREQSTGGMTMLISIPPGWTEERAEHHDCTEESYKISGDIWIVENGTPHTLCAGDYFIRPKHIKHGPMKTQAGTTSLIRFSSIVQNHYGPVKDEDSRHAL